MGVLGATRLPGPLSEADRGGGGVVPPPGTMQDMYRSEPSARPQLRGNTPGHIEAITALKKSICFGLKSNQLPTPWRASDSAGLLFSLQVGADSLELGRDAAPAG